MFVKGKSGNPNGRPKSATTSQIRNAIKERIDIGVLWEEIGELEKRDKVNAKLKLLEYATPRLSSVQASELTLYEQIKELGKEELAKLIDEIIDVYGEG